VEHEIITKQEAIERKLKTYFTGKPCPNGHIDLIYVNGRCRTCKLEGTNKSRAKAKTGKTGKRTKSKAVAIIPRNKLYDGGELPEWMRREGERVRRELDAVEESYIRIADKLAKVKGATTPRGFKEFCRVFGIGRTRTYELLQIADGRKTVKEVRPAGTERQRRSRGKRKAVRHVADSPEVVPVPDDTHPPIIEGEVIEVTPAREFGPYILNTDDSDDATLARKLLEWFGKERLSRVIAELQRLLAASEAA
jgi:hypothetical protein